MWHTRNWIDGEHRNLEQTLADIEVLAQGRSFGLAASKFKLFQRTLSKHLKEEEDILFPILRRRFPKESLLELMDQQHAQLEVTLEAIDRSLKQDDFQGFCSGLDALSRLLHGHQTTEEDFLTRISFVLPSGTPT